jgi:hypothetical protein
LTRASRAKRLAVKVIAGSKAARRRAEQLERGIFGGIITKTRELAQAYAHHNAAPFTTDQQVVLDEMFAARWNAYVEKNDPELPPMLSGRRAVVVGPRDAGGTQFLPLDKSRHGRVVHDNRMSSVPLEAVKGHDVVFHLDRPPNADAKSGRPVYEVRDLTDAEFRKLTAIYLYAEAACVDAAAFRAEASVAWESLRHRKVGMRVKGDLIERDRLDELSGDQAKELRRDIGRLRRIFDKQVR